MSISDPPFGGRARLALALGPGRLTAVRLRRAPWAAEPVEVMQCALPGDGGGVAALADALRDLGARGGTVDVALLRRFAHAKVVPLPPVRRAELGALVERNARRHFAVRDEPLVADGRRVGRPAPGAMPATLAACAPAALADAVAAAVRDAGFTLGGVLPAAVAVAEAVRALVPAARVGRVAVVAVLPGAAELIALDGGVPARVEPLAAADGAALAERVTAALAAEAEEGRPPSAVLVCGSDDLARELRDRLEAGTGTGAPPLLRDPRVERIPAEAVAALGAALARDGSPLLLPIDVRAERARRARRRTAWLSGGAAACALLAAWLHLWGVQREAERIDARREVLRPAVASALRARRGVEGVRARLEAVARREAEAPRWTGGMAALARALPDSAWLRSLTADSAGFRVAGVARSASTVVPALERSPAFEGVSLAAPVRWEAGDAGERFDLSVPLAAPESVRVAAAAAARAPRPPAISRSPATLAGPPPSSATPELATPEPPGPPGRFRLPGPSEPGS